MGTNGTRKPYPAVLLERPTHAMVIRELDAVGEATMSDLRTWA